MGNTMQVQTLIERAAVNLGTQAAVADALGERPTRLSAYKSGARPCPIETQAKLCELASLSEEEAKEHIYRAVRALVASKRKSRNS